MVRLMRLAALAIAVLLATAADAATQKQPQPPTPAAATGLRGAVSATAGAIPAKPAPISLISPSPDPAAPFASVTADHAECRRVCSHTYFFCLQTEGAEDCPQGWSSCLSDCVRPSPLLRSKTE